MAISYTRNCTVRGLLGLASFTSRNVFRLLHVWPVSLLQSSCGQVPSRRVGRAVLFTRSAGDGRAGRVCVSATMPNAAADLLGGTDVFISLGRMPPSGIAGSDGGSV